MRRRTASADRAVFLLGLFIAAVLLVIAVLIGWAAIQQRAHGRAMIELLRRRAEPPPHPPRREIRLTPKRDDAARDTGAPRC